MIQMGFWDWYRDKEDSEPVHNARNTYLPHKDVGSKQEDVYLPHKDVSSKQEDVYHPHKNVGYK